jgi:hypothetical protein
MKGTGGGMKQGWMGHKWDITELFLCGSCGENFTSRKQDRTMLGGNISGRGLFERGIRQCINNHFSMHCLWGEGGGGMKQG